MTIDQIGSPMQRLERHRRFWQAEQVERPLIAFTVGGWSPFVVSGATSDGYLSPDDLHPEAFVEYYKDLFALQDELEDDVYRSCQPYPSVPWMEALVGCRVRTSVGGHCWAEPLAGGLDELLQARYDAENPWVAKYVEFLDFYHSVFPQHPLGQSILRGPTDVLAAAIGDEAAVLACVDTPDIIMQAMHRITDVLQSFLEHQWQHMHSYRGGNVMGQYELWAPGRVSRLQEDATALYSPDMYRRFVLPCEERLCTQAAYNLLHTHASSLHLLEAILENRRLRALQISKDDGAATMEILLPGMLQARKKGKPVVVKGRFSIDDIDMMRSYLSPNGLCIQPVVDTVAEAREMMAYLTRW